MENLFTLSMNYQSTQNLQVSVNGTIRHFEPAIVALVNVNEVCILMMHFHDVCTLMICTVMVLLYDFMLNFNDMQCIWFYVKKYIHHRSFQIKRKFGGIRILKSWIESRNWFRGENWWKTKIRIIKYSGKKIRINWRKTEIWMEFQILAWRELNFRGGSCFEPPL